MKKLASAVGATILLLTAVPAGATSNEPGAGVNALQMAFASWLVSEQGETWLYYAAGTSLLPSTEPTIGFVGKAPCKEVLRHGRTGLRCRGGTRGRSLTPGDFMMDPALNAATLRMEAKDEIHTVTWQGRGDLSEPYVHQHAGLDVGVLAMTMMARRANTTGTVFGQELSGKRGVLFEEVIATAWTNVLLTRDGTRLAFDDGTLTVTKTFF